MNQRSYFILPLLFLASLACSQTVTIAGSVFGLTSEKVLLMRKASKNVSFEGPINGARIHLTGPKDIDSKTDITGGYSITLSATGIYSMTVEKQGYSKLTLTLNYTDDGLKTFFPAVSFMLKKEDNAVNALGEITISDGGKFNFIPLAASVKKATEVFQSNQILLEKAGLINNSSAANVINLASATPRIKTVKVAVPEPVKADSIAPRKEEPLAVPVMELISDTSTSIAGLQNTIERSKELLKTMAPDDRQYAMLLAQVKNAEALLAEKEAVISLQEAQLSESRKKMMFLGLFALCAVLAAGLLLLFLRQRKKHILVLDEKNKAITKMNNRVMSSIRYAATIQGNFFKEKSELGKLFGKAFIFNQPKEALSGDFYWFARKGDQRVLVVADCTGHGVPGALLTVLGHGLLDDIVLVKGETTPSRILMQLCEGVIAAFAKSEELEYGMDITVLAMKDGSDEVVFSGITNGLYHGRAGTVKHLAVTPKTIGPDLQPGDLSDQVVKVTKGDCFFLLSDGFADQFNENIENPEKLNIQRMEKVLGKISTGKDFQSAQEVLKSEIESWKGTREQTDDILVVGVKID